MIMKFVKKKKIKKPLLTLTFCQKTQITSFQRVDRNRKENWDCKAEGFSAKRDKSRKKASIDEEDKVRKNNSRKRGNLIKRVCEGRSLKEVYCTKGWSYESAGKEQHTWSDGERREGVPGYTN